jgi:hypothetical protein
VRKACFQRNVGAALLAFHQTQTRALDASLENKAMHGDAHRLFEEAKCDTLNPATFANSTSELFVE